MAKEQITYIDAEERRKKIWTSQIGRYANTAKAIREPASGSPEEDSANIRHAISWQDWMLPYPTEDIVYTPGANCDANTKFPDMRPGVGGVWFEHVFEHSIQGVVKTDDDYEFKFNQTEKTDIYAIYNDNTCTINFEGDQETWNEEFDDFRPGTPFVVSETESNDGFYRVKSRREEGSFVYIIVDNNKYEQQDLTIQSTEGTAKCDFGGDWYQFLGHDGNSQSANNTPGGDMTAYLNTLGDSVYNSNIQPEWWTSKDKYHRYQGNVLGPNDGRPPSGGQISKDFNGNWIRGTNNNLYHTYDENSHRWVVRAETDGSQPPYPGGSYEQFASITPAADFLSFQPDAKEIVSPFRYDDTDRTSWKYGSKVRLKSNQITDASELGAINNVIRTGIEVDTNYTGFSSHSQYQSIYKVDHISGNKVEKGDWPDVGDQSPKDVWIDDKYNKALQNTVERIVTQGNWGMFVDETYIENWVSLYKHLPILLADISGWDVWDNGYTYSEYDEVHVSLQVYVSLQNNNQNHLVTDTDWWRKLTVGEAENYAAGTGWQPDINGNQNEIALIDDELWGENGSGFELLLKKLGSFDWYYDETFVFQSERTLDDAWEWASYWVEQVNDSFPQTHNGVVCNSAEDIMNAWWRKPVGCWRRTWERSLGKPHGDDTVMRSTEPTFETYASNGAAYPENVLGDPDRDYINDPFLYGLFGGVMDDILMFGHLVMDTPAETEDEAGIDARHQATYTVNEHAIYVDNVKQIISDAGSILNMLTTFEDSIGIELLGLQTNPGGDLTTDWGVAKSTYIADVAALTPVLAALEDNDDLTNAQILISETKDSSGRFRVSGTNVYNGLSITLSKEASLKYTESGEYITKIVFYANTNNDHYDENVELLKYDSGVENVDAYAPGWKGLIDLICFSDAENYYIVAEIKASDAGIITWDSSSERYTFKYTLEHIEEPYFTLKEPAGLLSPVLGRSVAAMRILTNATVFSSPDFTYPDIIFTRSYERADYKLVDPEP